MKSRLGLAALLLLGGCAANDFTKPGASEEQFVSDEALCRGQLGKAVAAQRRVEDSRRDTMRGEQERFGQTALPDTMAAISDKNRSGKMLESCMIARGWQPKSPWWQRLGT